MEVGAVAVGFNVGDRVGVTEVLAVSPVLEGFTLNNADGTAEGETLSVVVGASDGVTETSLVNSFVLIIPEYFNVDINDVEPVEPVDKNGAVDILLTLTGFVSS